MSWLFNFNPQRTCTTRVTAVAMCVCATRVYNTAVASITTLGGMAQFYAQIKIRLATM